MASEKNTLKALVGSIISYQEELAKLYEQAAKEVSDRQTFQFFRQLTSQNEQHATELKALLEHQPGNKEIQVDNKKEGLNAEKLDGAGYDESVLVNIAIKAEKKLIDTFEDLLETDQIPASVKQAMKNQLEFNKHSYQLLQDLL